MNLNDKVCVITGAAGVLGKAVVAAFATAGARLVLLDIDARGLAAAYPDADSRFHLAPVDLLRAAEVARTVEDALARLGGIYCLCNVAGGFRMGAPVHETSDDDWSLMMDVNVRSAINAVRAVVPQMLKVGAGKIINVAAAAALTGKAGMGAYCAAKSAVVRLTESMAAELREHGINVNCVLPSILDTPANRAAMPNASHERWVAPEALADVMLFLASDRSRAIHGAAIPVVGLA
jgi:NAD(P)-dependent dehydrogenase (short-subunit alcohol dehydrogenase family)